MILSSHQVQRGLLMEAIQRNDSTKNQVPRRVVAMYMSKNRVLEHREYEVLKAISREQPLGARQLYNYLQDANLKMSESTISRILRQLDKQGFTTSKGNKGRVLTEFGEDFVKGLRTEQRWRDNLADLALHTSEDVLDLLHARHAVEAEVVQIARASCRERV